MTNTDQPPPRLDRLAAYAETFDDSAFVPAGFVPQGQPGAAWSMEHVVYAAPVRAFVETAYEDDWVRTGFDWVAWSRGPAARALSDDSATLDDASVSELAYLLTAVIRQERFSEGSLIGAFEGGLIVRILRRVRALADETAPAEAEAPTDTEALTNPRARAREVDYERPTEPPTASTTAPEALALLAGAVEAYAYPCVTFDFERQTERTHADVRELEDVIRADLLAAQAERVKAGLANIIYWGYGRQGRRDARVRSFLDAITPEQLQRASETFAVLNGPGLRQLKHVGLPRFTQITFLSKLRMFLDPERYAALDLKLAKLRFEAPATLLHDLKVQPTSIPVTEHNERVYTAWCTACKEFAASLGSEHGWRAADIERGFFHLVDTGHAAAAARLLARSA